MFVLTLILILLCLLTYIRISNNEDLVVANAKDETDIANIKNAQKVYRKSKEAQILLYIALISLFILLICAFTDIDFYLIDYISLDLVSKENIIFNFNYFFFPIYVLVIREILIQVKIGEFLLKFFKAEEPHLEESPLVSLKSLLYKKPKQTNNQPTSSNSPTNNPPIPNTSPISNQEINNSNITELNNNEIATANINSNSSIDLPKINNKPSSLDVPNSNNSNNNSNIDLPQSNQNK